MHATRTCTRMNTGHLSLYCKTKSPPPFQMKCRTVRRSMPASRIWGGTKTSDFTTMRNYCNRLCDQDIQRFSTKMGYSSKCTFPAVHAICGLLLSPMRLSRARTNTDQGENGRGLPTIVCDCAPSIFEPIGPLPLAPQYFS